jgi:putative PEP-CTERM system histidine kinase
MTALAAPLLAIAALRDRRLRRDPPVSRAFVFHGATLVVAGTFLLAVGALSETLRQFGEPWTRTAQAALLAAAVLALALALSARSVRSRLRRLLAEHFFRARYDYRAEWLRCLATLSAAGDDPAISIIRALADAVDSPSGVLLLRGPNWQYAGGWNAGAEAWPPIDDPTTALRHGHWVAQPAPGEMPALRARFGTLWLVVPLMHHRDGLLGAVLLARPRSGFTPDREVFDLLRMLGREVAQCLAERQGAERLAQEAQLQAHAHRFAFVAHDVKNVASQLTLLLGNAEDHIANPEFQRDMLMTVRAAAERINALIARLRVPEAAAADRTEPLARLEALALASPHRLEIEGASPGPIAMQAEHFDTAVTHLVNNAAEAGAGPVRLRFARDGGRAWLDITDQGPGMTADFVRDDLFRPLATTRPGGSGIGAWQARELLRRAGGDLEVTTAPGKGTTMRILLPGLAA